MGTMTKAYDGDAKALIVTWAGYSTGDTVPAFTVPGKIGILGCMQSAGGATTVELHGSVDGDTFSAVTMPTGDTISISGDGVIDFSTAAPYVRPSITGTDITASIALRGNE